MGSTVWFPQQIKTCSLKVWGLHWAPLYPFNILSYTYWGSLHVFFFFHGCLLHPDKSTFTTPGAKVGLKICPLIWVDTGHFESANLLPECLGKSWFMVVFFTGSFSRSDSLKFHTASHWGGLFSPAQHLCSSFHCMVQTCSTFSLTS